MIQIESVLDAYINANLLLCAALGLWLVARLGLARTRLGGAFGTQLQLLNAVFVTVIFAPLIALGFNALQGAGVASGVNMNLSDMAVSYYLSGAIEMKASDFQGWLHLRESFTANVVNASGWAAWTAIVLFSGGLLLGLARLAYSLLCLRRIVGGSFDWRRFGRICIRVSDRTVVPFSTRGLRNYYVVIPAHMLTQPDAIKVSLAHEFQHIRQGDLEWEILLEALKPLFFINPAYHIWKRQVENLRELNCDTAVLTRGRISLRTYCDTLLSICQDALRRDKMLVSALPKVALITADKTPLRPGRSLLERRITSLLDRRKLTRPGLTYAAIALPLVLSIAALTIAIQRPGDWSQDRLMLSSVVNLERLDAINRSTAAQGGAN